GGGGNIICAVCVFTYVRVEPILADLKEQYLSNSRPWVIGFSGGKDSTCTLQLVYQMLLSLPPDQLIKPVYVLSSDTMVEAPVVGARQKKICGMIAQAAEGDGLPIHVEVLRPDISDTFWVNLIGRGYPSPNRWFRWCTDRLKIKPMNKYILNHIKQNGEVLIILGARKSESTSRSQTMAKHEIENTRLRKHNNIDGAFVYTPIEDMTESEVWDYLGSNPSPWGDDNRELRSMYQKNDSEEIAFIIDEASPPSGHSRFGCWTCTVVEKDKALISLIGDGYTEYEPLLEFRDNLRKIRDDPQCREKYRKNQRVDRFIAEYTGVDADKQTHRGHEVMGPFTLETRHELLKKLLKIQEVIQNTSPEVELISPEEIKAIELLWMYEGDFIGDPYGVVNGPNDDSVDKLISTLIQIERDMSDVSRRVGVYKKLETVILEYTMNDLVKDKPDAGEWHFENY
ncbi:MAG: DNA phosphorothioation system sulfurtransferase DndC, partial [Methanomassiliicoccaceae archaeon]|nr:DNA phosphorothioation system sulfurtransferase DndC [Methanomassiliicoccaceae archaeon]